MKKQHVKQVLAALVLVLLVSACVEFRPGSPLDRAVEETKTTENDARNDLPRVFGSIKALNGHTLTGLTYKKEPTFSLEAQQVVHTVSLDYDTGTSVTITTLSPLERTTRNLKIGSTEIFDSTSVNFGDDWATWFNGSDLYEVTSTDPLSVANNLITTNERLDMKKYQFLWFYKGLPLPPKGANLVEVGVSKDGEKRFTVGSYVKADEDSLVKITVAKDYDFEEPYNAQDIELSGKTFLAGYVGQDYVLVNNARPVSIEARTAGEFARANTDFMKELSQSVAVRIVTNSTV